MNKQFFGDRFMRIERAKKILKQKKFDFATEKRQREILIELVEQVEREQKKGKNVQGYNQRKKALLRAGKRQLESLHNVTIKKEDSYAKYKRKKAKSDQLLSLNLNKSNILLEKIQSEKILDWIPRFENRINNKRTHGETISLDKIKSCDSMEQLKEVIYPSKFSEKKSLMLGFHQNL